MGSTGIGYTEIVLDFGSNHNFMQLSLGVSIKLEKRMRAYGEHRECLPPNPLNSKQDKSSIFGTVLGHECCLVIQSKCSQQENCKII
jgi:hypothetical protein